ncbi:beta-propeller fold lactonase family protein [Edaphobacter paludis]|uniref:Beta-propeller fold lactonase family protein n=1 Tax=Edaphobacter paludis TaxID=3035702 RepID=A0AAU7CXT3_9BACT
MNTLQRCLASTAAICLLGCLFGCSNGTTNISAPVLPPTTLPTPPATSSPTATAKPKFVYTGNQGKSLSGYAVNLSTGSLTSLSGFPVALGLNPTIVTHDPQNRFLIVADNSAFLLHVFAIDATTGALSEISPSPYVTKIQPGKVTTDPSGTHVYLYRAGQNVAFPSESGNQVFAYNLSSTGVLTDVVGAPFFTSSTVVNQCTGITTDSTGKFLYLQDLFNLYTFSIDGNSGALILIQTVPSGYGGGIALDPAGSYLYAAGSNSILTYEINPTSGTLKLAKSSPTAKQAGAYTIAVSPTGNSAYTIEDNNYLVSYSITDGTFVPVGTIHPDIYGQQIAVDPSGSFVYVPQGCSNCPSGVYNVVHEFSIGSTGALTPLPDATVAAGITPLGITVTSQ